MTPIQTTVLGVLAEASDAPSPRLDWELAAFGLDSVRMLEVLMALEDHFDVVMDESDPRLLQVTTVAELAGFVQVRVSDGRHAPYWIAEREVTAAEWLAFLNESAQQRTVDAALAEGVGTLYPRASGRVADSAMWHRSEDGTWLLPDTWSPDWPVLGISYLDAVAYAVWRTARDGRGTYRLPMAWQTVVAGTGDAVQRFSWGSRFDQRFSNSCFSRRVARPEPVLANPRDESVFGVYDTTGGALEWTPDWFDDTRDLRHAVGGSWAQARVDVLAVGGGQGFSEESCSFIVVHWFSFIIDIACHAVFFLQRFPHFIFVSSVLR